MILLTVLMIIGVMMIFTIGLLSRSVTQTITAEQQIERIKVEQFAKGVFWRTYSDLATGANITSVNISEQIDGRPYVAYVQTLNTPGPNNTRTYQVDVPY